MKAENLFEELRDMTVEEAYLYLSPLVRNVPQEIECDCNLSSSEKLHRELTASPEYLEKVKRAEMELDFQSLETPKEEPKEERTSAYDTWSDEDWDEYARYCQEGRAIEEGLKTMMAEADDRHAAENYVLHGVFAPANNLVTFHKYVIQFLKLYEDDEYSRYKEAAQQAFPELRFE